MKSEYCNEFANKPEVTEERLQELLETINNKSLDDGLRNAAKHELLLAHTDFIWRRVFGRTTGKIGIDDRQSELFDSAYAYLHGRASDIARRADDSEDTFEQIIAQRIKGWYGDKIRKSDGLSKKRGKCFQKQSSDALENVIVNTNSAEEEAIQAETFELIHDAINEALKVLDELEVFVALSYVGKNGPAVSLRKIADLRNIPYIEVQKVWRRARDKMRKLLETSVSTSDLS